MAYNSKATDPDGFNMKADFQPAIGDLIDRLVELEREVNWLRQEKEAMQTEIIQLNAERLYAYEISDLRKLMQVVDINAINAALEQFSDATHEV